MKKPPSRTERRHQSSDSRAPKKKDGTRVIYLGFVLSLLAVFAVFGAMNWNHQRRVAQAYATPSPGPNATAASIQLADGESLGKPALAVHTDMSGLGAPVDGITCDNGMTTTGEFLHIHSHLALIVHGRQMQIPARIGMVPTANGGCLYWVHTHDASGIIHVESPHVTAPRGGKYTLGMFFRIWGQALSRQRVGPYAGPVTAFVNGTLYKGDLSEIPLYAHQEITLEVGQPLVAPANYAFPPNS